MSTFHPILKRVLSLSNTSLKQAHFEVSSITAKHLLIDDLGIWRPVVSWSPTMYDIARKLDALRLYDRLDIQTQQAYTAEDRLKMIAVHAMYRSTISSKKLANHLFGIQAAMKSMPLLNGWWYCHDTTGTAEISDLWVRPTFIGQDTAVLQIAIEEHYQ